ncbi:MAG TPA: 16S rRNA (cytosine(1402)-N(4))-methyltransferase, partial [Nitrospirae bacterium]|nr:16S rRNA (cytosine(1402)-N(4))-methyltransferase [Nitrospirota bacterium]
IVKRYFISLAKEGRVRKLNKKPLRPSADELRENPSSRSAKLRGVERL